MIKFKSLTTDNQFSTEYELKNVLGSKIKDYIYLSHKIDTVSTELSSELLDLISNYLILDPSTIIIVEFNPLISRVNLKSNDVELEQFLNSLDITFDF